MQYVNTHYKSEYPFNGEIRITIGLPQDASFPMYFRIPSYIGNFAERTSVAAGGKTYFTEPGVIFKVERRWENGERIHVSIPMDIKCEKRSSNSVAIKRGPLYLALRIGEDYNQIRHNFKGSADWVITPTTPLNVALYANF